MERDQIEDMLARSEAQTDTKFERLLGEMRETAARQDAKFDTRAARQDAKFDALLSKIEGFQTDVRDLRAEVRSESRATRSIILWTVLPAIIATALAIVGILLATQANQISAFSAGVAVRSAPVAAPEASKPGQ